MRQRIEAGFSLLGTLIALAVAATLTAAAISVLSSARGTTSRNNELARQAEKARLAIDLMAEDAQRAGMAGCTANAAAVSAVDGGVGGSTGTLGGTLVSGDYAIWYSERRGSTTVGVDFNLLNLSVQPLGINLSLTPTASVDCFAASGLSVDLFSTTPQLPNQTTTTEWYVTGSGNSRPDTLMRCLTTTTRSCRAIVDGVKGLQVRYLRSGQTTFQALPATLADRRSVVAAQLVLSFPKSDGGTRQIGRVVALRRSADIRSGP